jgi:ABC-type arginine transport system ATPase subunit
MFALTPSGALLWKHLADWTTQEQLVELVLKEYEVTADRASADVEEFLEQLRQLRALESEGGE